MRNIEVKAPAKINFGLSIVSKRDDGFHNLETIFYPINDLYDRLFFETSNKFAFECSDASLSTDESNIVVKAVRIFENEIKQNVNLKIYLEKNIPIGGGLGGGSSDAASTLVALNKLFSAGLNYGQLMEMALKIGSDVPFFIKAKPSLGESRGEVLKEIPFKIDKPILIVNPGIYISTKDAFKNITPQKSENSYAEIVELWNDDYYKLRRVLKNDFENWVFSKYPEIGEVKQTLLDSGAIIALMSGSGSTLFGIFENKEKADYAAQNLHESCFKFISLPQK
ncbi:4-(cytidine 5'-diphospho)-2-C-methyl-D-erythritol kinase [Bacteroidota bacterium]